MADVLESKSFDGSLPVLLHKKKKKKKDKSRGEIKIAYRVYFADGTPPHRPLFCLLVVQLTDGRGFIRRVNRGDAHLLEGRL